MSDDKNKQGNQDDIRVDRNDASEIAYLQQQFPGKTIEELKQAVANAGPLRENIIAYLVGRRSPHEQ